MKFTIRDYLEETASHFPEKVAFTDVNSSVTWTEFVERAKEKSALNVFTKQVI